MEGLANIDLLVSKGKLFFLLELEPLAVVSLNFTKYFVLLCMYAQFITCACWDKQIETFYSYWTGNIEDRIILHCLLLRNTLRLAYKNQRGGRAMYQ